VSFAGSTIRSAAGLSFRLAPSLPNASLLRSGEKLQPIR
jgi:hypothetical protein